MRSFRMRSLRLKQLSSLIVFITIILTSAPDYCFAENSKAPERIDHTTSTKLNSLAQSQSPAEECLIFNDDNVAFGFFQNFKIGERVVSYYEPVECEADPYPFAITGFHVALFDFALGEWPLTIDLVVYDTSGSDKCGGPGVELFRQTVVVDSLDFQVPQIGFVLLTDPICVDGPFFAGVEYSAADSAKFPSVVFDTNPDPDSCDNWVFRDEWYEFSDFWGNDPGYPIIRIEGETVASLCCPDADDDGICDPDDNCPTVANADQLDSDSDDYGDLCDNCPSTANPDQLDSDSDQAGDLCDDCPFDSKDDADGDGVCADIDNCPCDFNPSQTDSDTDGTGDLCESCCTGQTGDLDDNLDGSRNLADITRLIDRVYISNRRLCCETAGNVNGDIENKINLADITRLIDHVYLTKAETEACM